MMEQEANGLIQSCIDHIKTAVDVDPWAAELAEKALKQYMAGWISVKDRLPEIGAKCLVYADGKMTVAKHVDHNDWITGMFFPVPTHWKPLPEPPKEGSDRNG